MEESIRSIRVGLLRVIPDVLVGLLAPDYISSYLVGDTSVDISVLRSHVGYEGKYNESHRVIKLFWHLLENEFSKDDVRKLLLFWTGNSILHSNMEVEEEV